MAGRTLRGPSRRTGWTIVCGFGLVWLLLVQSHAAAQAEPGAVYVAEITGVINPLSAEYLVRALQTAERNGAAALYVRLDTPGGLDSAMRTIIQAILDSRVPVVVHVAPPGARAASAGLFISMSAHVAAMAPGTNIGAAHPVALGGESTDETMASKVTNDAAAYIRALAATRGRNADWAEQAVRESVSVPAEDAVTLRVVDLLEGERDGLLRAIDGRVVRTPAGEVQLRTAQAPEVPIPMNPLERLLHVLTDPNLALLLLTIGTIGLIAELYNPGTWIPGTIGAIALILAFAALGNLPTNWAGVALIMLAGVLLVAETQAPGVGLFGLGAAVAFVLGALFLFRPLGDISPAAPNVEVNPVLVAGLGMGAAAFGFVVLRAVARAQLSRVAVGPEAMVGTSGTAQTQLAPHGVVRIRGEDWTAVAIAEPIETGAPVEVVGVEGVTLTVRPMPPRGTADRGVPWQRAD